jgi:hypothetical protein
MPCRCFYFSGFWLCCHWQDHNHKHTGNLKTTGARLPVHQNLLRPSPASKVPWGLPLPWALWAAGRASSEARVLVLLLYNVIVTTSYHVLWYTDAYIYNHGVHRALDIWFLNVIKATPISIAKLASGSADSTVHLAEGTRVRLAGG